MPAKSSTAAPLVRTDRSSSPMRLCMLGCGEVAKKHSKRVRGLGVECSFASRTPGKARDFNERLNGVGAYGSYEEAIASNEIDVVAVLTPPHQHLELTLAALDAGKDVIVEKPPFFHSTDFDTVEAACEASGRQVYVAENYFYKPLAVTLRRLLAEGVVGDPLFLHINAIKKQETGDWRDDPSLSGPGALFEGGIHWVNFLANLGPNITRTEGTRPGTNREAIERSMLVTFEYDNGLAATLSYSWEVPSTFKGLRLSKLYGTRGSVLFETNGIFCFAHGTTTRLLSPGLRDIQGYRAMFADFVRAWRVGGEPAMTRAIARRDLELIEIAYKTAERGEQSGKVAPDANPATPPSPGPAIVAHHDRSALSQPVRG